MADLIDLSKIPNDGYKWLLTVVDIFSKYARQEIQCIAIYREFSNSSNALLQIHTLLPHRYCWIIVGLDVCVSAHKSRLAPRLATKS